MLKTGTSLKGSYRHYLLTVLLVILAFNFVDRAALGVLLPDIKADLRLSDTQLGFLSGIAFALFYSLMGIPIARWADRGDRTAIIAMCTGIWSVGVALCGLAGSFAQLLLIRVAVAVGEAGCTPPAFSLIADYFSRSERPRAVAIYGLGVPLGIIFALVCAGWLNECYGWRMTFVLLGAPGLILMGVARFTLREPRKSQQIVDVAYTNVGRQPGPPIGGAPTVVTVCAILWANTTFRQLLMCFSVQSLFAYGVLAWLPTFFSRSFGMPSGAIGTSLALTWGFGGLLGSYLGGELASRFAAHNERLQLRGMTFTVAAAGALSLGAYVARESYLSFALIGLSATALGMVNGPLFATIQTLVPGHIRAVSIAILYLCANLIGLGLGPLLIGVLSDTLRPWAGDESVRYALMILVCPGYFWGAWHAWRASRMVEGDLRTLFSNPTGHDDPTISAVDGRRSADCLATMNKS